MNAPAENRNAPVRLDRWLADMTRLSRKEAGKLIRKRKVLVNETINRDPASLLDPARDTVLLDGQPILYEPYQYFLLNKPAGVLSAVKDAKRRTVIDLLPPQRRSDLFPVGRLDLDTTGLMLITNDGELAHRLLSPARHVDKTYLAWLKGIPDERAICRFAEGIVYDADLRAKPAELLVVKTDADNGTAMAQVTIQEGKFHQVKKMFAAVNCEVTQLQRISFGPLQLQDLDLGKSRLLTKEELSSLRLAAGL